MFARTTRHLRPRARPPRLSTTTTYFPPPPEDRLLRYWLLSTAGAVFGMIVLGGVTRLTRSGLSMVDWKPLGRFPPSTLEEWEGEFEKYKQFPEYKLLNKTMTLEEFKKIFWMEWAHRTYGRGLGVLYGVPLVYFLASGRAKRAGGGALQAKLGGLLVAGGSQGLVGWWMVKSGLEEPEVKHKEPRVSPYRLTAHLVMAVGLYSGLLWTAWSLHRPQLAAVPASKFLTNFKTRSGLVTALVGTTMVSGAFVAGNDAGRAFNDWPFFAGDWLPEGLWKKDMGYKNFLENTATVQFDHRMLAYSTLAGTSGIWYMAAKAPAGTVPLKARSGFRYVGLAAWAQASLGIVTLMTVVPVSLGSLHQAGALIVWTFSLYAQHALRYIR